MSLAVSIDAREQKKRDDHKQLLLARVQAENALLMDALNAFHNTELHDTASYYELGEAVVTAIDKVLGDGDWEDSLFLRNTAKPLKALRENMISRLSSVSAKEVEVGYELPLQTEDTAAAYILVYQSQGHDLSKWAQLLKTLDKYALGRPVYANEADAEKVLRVKMSKMQDAYVKVVVPRAALQTDTMFSNRQDRFGNVLLTLPAGVVDATKILEFVHAGKRYHYVKGELIDVSSTAKCN